MSTSLNDLPADEINNALHVLLIAPTKLGKTDWVAQAILDGFTVLYVDNDNGLNSLLAALGDNEAAKSRCHYVKTSNIWNFLLYFFARNRFQWNKTKDDIFAAGSAADDDLILEIYPKRIPFGVIIVFDSWTSICLQLITDSAAKNSVPLETFNEKGQAVYGDANRRANTVLTNLQAFPTHVIVQAHPDTYEKKEKPLGSQKGVKQEDMKIVDIIDIPSSVTRPHGYTMGKYFNEIGWIYLSPMNKFILDFTQDNSRIGGGSKQAKGDPRVDLRFSKIVKPRTIDGSWIRALPAKGLKDEAFAEAEAAKIRAAEKAAEAAAKKATPTAATNPAQANPAPARTGSLLGKRA